jgi:mediator of RNA polymerase II transcription subunit 13
LPLPHDPSRPGPIITPGKSLTLLPKGISAYLIANYTGPTATLEEDFKACLPGLVPDAPDSSPNQSSFVIVWIEMVDDGPRGLICIWPRLLCMVTTTLPDRHVSTLPDLPPELRPYASISSSCENASSSGTPICPINRRRNLRKHRPMKPTPRQGHCQNSIDVRRNGLSNTSLNVNIYISALVKHRDAERERLKRERDIATGAKKDASNTKEAASHTRNESPPIKVERDAPPPAPPPLNTRTNPLAIDTKDLGTSSQRVQSTSPPVAEDASLFSDDDDDGDASPPPPPTLPDSLSNLDMSWPPDPTSNGNFLPMNSETDFGMSNAESLSHLGIGNIQFPMISSAHNTDNNQHMMDLDFANNLGAFTDADFSFFDAPGTSTQFLPIQPPAPTAEMFISATGLTPSAGPVPFGLSPPTFYDHQQTNEQISTPWTGHLLSPSLAPSGAAMAVDEVATTPSSAPTILPSMPPTVASSPVVKLRADTASPSASSTLVMFDAIPFAASHLNVDDKYTSGKFSVSYDSRVGTSVSVLKGWREVYNNATDPHVGIAKKIAQHRIGVPSKSPAGNARTAQWVKDHDYEAWEPLAAGADVDEEMPSPDDSDDETLTSAEVLSFPPGNLPLGSILLAAHFLPGLLLPMTIPSPPTASGAPSPAGVPGATPAGVPTPLSPTTLQGAETEKLRNLEAAAQVLASEFVSNRQWMEAWVAAQDGNSGQNSMIATDTHDINLVNDALRGCKSLQNRLFVRSLLEDDTHDNAMDSGSLDIMTSPSVYVSQSAAILKVQPSAVRFWEKLGLHPRGGHKNVTALVFYDQRSIPTEAVDAWSAGITAAYEVIPSRVIYALRC